MPAGRVGLLPESMTQADDTASNPAPRPGTAAAPPWTGERPGAGEPPPWESGPWPGPGGQPEAASPPPGAPGGRSQVRPAAGVVNRQARLALIAGVVPLVVPGAVLGVLGLRRARTAGTGRPAAWAGIGLSAIWAVVLIAVFAWGGGAAQHCPGPSRPAVSHAMQVVLGDLSRNAPAAVVSADMQRALTQANSAAAAAQQASPRTALISLTGSLQRGLAAVAGGHSASEYAAVRKDLAAADATVAGACTG